MYSGALLPCITFRQPFSSLTDRLLHVLVLVKDTVFAQRPELKVQQSWGTPSPSPLQLAIVHCWLIWSVKCFWLLVSTYHDGYYPAETFIRLPAHPVTPEPLTGLWVSSPVLLGCTPRQPGSHTAVPPLFKSPVVYIVWGTGSHQTVEDFQTLLTLFKVLRCGSHPRHISRMGALEEVWASVS